jgi:hypothetical protein
MTMSSQLWRAVLAGSSMSADQQDAAPDEDGTYGELVEAIDEIVGEDAPETAPRTARKKSRSGPSKRNRSSKRSG